MQDTTVEQKAAFAFCDDVVTSKQGSLSPPPALCYPVLNSDSARVPECGFVVNKFI